MIFVVSNLLSGCASAPSTSNQVTPLTGAERDATIADLNATLVANNLAPLKSNESRVLCSNYERANWDIDQALDPLIAAAGDNADAWRDYHNHFTLVAILQERSGLPIAEQIAQSVKLLRAFCGSL